MPSQIFISENSHCGGYSTNYEVLKKIQLLTTSVRKNTLCVSHELEAYRTGIMV
jgi:hypothetical protein